MNTVQVRNVVIGEGSPKVIVPIVGVTKEEIIQEAKSLESLQLDVVEWRCDWFEEALNQNVFLEVLHELRTILKEIPLLVTFRTAKEGGKRAVSLEEYIAFNTGTILSGDADLVDVELFSGDEVVSELIDCAHSHNVKVVASSHDFDKTPDKEELISRLTKMQNLGADLPKIAVMPTCKKDVLTLLEATEEFSSQFADRPIITMSMSSLGVISRLSGEAFGSAMTFGAASKASAPGQMNVNDLQTVLNLLHKAM